MTEPLLPHEASGERRRSLAWALAAAVVVLVAAAIPLYYLDRYYFYGDTQVGSFGQWYRFGEMLRDGHWPLLDLQAWRAGNNVAEGQLGLFNPLVMAISLGASVTPNAVLYATGVKLGTLLLAAMGTFLLARSYRLRPPVAFVAAIAVPAGGTTQYLDSPSWMTGLMVWALLP